jgi:hypothetical protein
LRQLQYANRAHADTHAHADTDSDTHADSDADTDSDAHTDHCVVDGNGIEQRRSAALRRDREGPGRCGHRQDGDNEQQR